MHLVSSTYLALSFCELVSKCFSYLLLLSVNACLSVPFVFSPISPLYACCSSCSLPPPSSAAPPLLVCQTLRPAPKQQLTVGTSPSFFCQHSMACFACQLNTVQHVMQQTCTGQENEPSADFLSMPFIRPYVTYPLSGHQSPDVFARTLL